MRTRFIAAAFALLLGGCGGAETTTGLSDDAFIETMVGLRKAAVEQPQSFAAEKERVLGEQGVTEEQLRAYIQAHLENPEHLAEIWQSVNERMALLQPH